MLGIHTGVSPVDITARRALALRAGMTVRVWQKIVEDEKTRLQNFEGLIIACRHGGEAGATFTVRRVASGVGMERTFPLLSPMIGKIEIVKKAKVRRAKLYYVRTKSRRDIRRKVKQTDFVAVIAPTEAELATTNQSNPESEME